MHIVEHNVNKETITKHNNNQELTNKNYNKNIYNKKIQRSWSNSDCYLECYLFRITVKLPYLELEETG